MFFSLVRKNSRRSRKENGLFYASLLISIIAFYIILSLEQQDVMIFLKTMESDAVNKLLGMIPLLYGMTLFLLFFLIYFASKYQMDRRSHEFGVYLMMGMKRWKLFAMMLAEDVWSNLISLVLGIPLAVVLAELISLVTSKLVGLGIIGHQFTFSLKAVVWTAAGFVGVKFLALVILSGRIARQEIAGMLFDSQEEKQHVTKRGRSVMFLSVGIVLLCAAYGLAILGFAWSHALFMGITLAAGLWGTFWLFRGISSLLEMVMKKDMGDGRQEDGQKRDRLPKKDKLKVFTFRQLQENVILQHSSQAVASLLVLAALCCFGFGISMGSRASRQEGHSLDFTFHGDGRQIMEQLTSPQLAGFIDSYFEVRLGRVKEGLDREVNAKPLMEKLEKLEDSREKEVLLNNLQYFDYPYLISLAGYNRVLEVKGEEPLVLGSGEAALYSDYEFTDDARAAVLEKAMAEDVTMKLAGEDLRIVPGLCRDSFVVDRAITISYALIIPDELFERLVGEEGVSSYWNAVLDADFVEESGLMQAVKQVDSILKGSGLEYESYLQNMGRQLFYVVGSSYLTIYLAVIFLIIANTVMGVQFLMQQRKTGRRYQVLVKLGGDYESLRRSGRKQVKWYFGLPVLVAVISSFFGLWALFSGLLPSGIRDQIFMLLGAGVAVVGLLCVVECIYMTVVMRLSDRHIRELMRTKRQE